MKNEYVLNSDTSRGTIKTFKYFKVPIYTNVTDILIHQRIVVGKYTEVLDADIEPDLLSFTAVLVRFEA